MAEASGDGLETAWESGMWVLHAVLLTGGCSHCFVDVACTVSFARFEGHVVGSRCVFQPRLQGCCIRFFVVCQKKEAVGRRLKAAGKDYEDVHTARFAEGSARSKSCRCPGTCRAHVGLL